MALTSMRELPGKERKAKNVIQSTFWHSLQRQSSQFTTRSIIFSSGRYVKKLLFYIYLRKRTQKQINLFTFLNKVNLSVFIKRSENISAEIHYLRIICTWKKNLCGCYRFDSPRSLWSKKAAKQRATNCFSKMAREKGSSKGGISFGYHPGHPLDYVLQTRVWKEKERERRRRRRDSESS